MGEKMTLGKVRDDLREWKAQSHKDRFDYPENKVAPCEEDYSNWADAIDAHLATPAQTVDVEAVREVTTKLEAANALLRESLDYLARDWTHIEQLAERIEAHLQGAGDEAGS